MDNISREKGHVLRNKSRASLQVLGSVMGAATYTDLGGKNYSEILQPHQSKSRDLASWSRARSLGRW